MGLDGVKVLGGLDTLLSATKETWVAVAIGFSKVRERVVQKLSGNSDIRFATLIPTPPGNVKQFCKLAVSRVNWR